MRNALAKYSKLCTNLLSKGSSTVVKEPENPVLIENNTSPHVLETIAFHGENLLSRIRRKDGGNLTKSDLALSTNKYCKLI